MPDLAIENAVLTNLKAYIIAGNTTRFNVSNVMVVPWFDQPPMHFTDVMVQIKYPEVFPYGQAGYSYLQKVTFEIAVFKRQSTDPKKYWESVLTDLNETLLVIRQRVNGYTGGTGFGFSPLLAIALFDSHQVMTARTLTNDKGEIIKDVAWSAARFWCLPHGTNVDLFKTGDYDGPISY